MYPQVEVARARSHGLTPGNASPVQPGNADQGSGKPAHAGKQPEKSRRHLQKGRFLPPGLPGFLRKKKVHPHEHEHGGKKQPEKKRGHVRSQKCPGHAPGKHIRSHAPEKISAQRPQRPVGQYAGHTGQKYGGRSRAHGHHMRHARRNAEARQHFIKQRNDDERAAHAEKAVEQADERAADHA